MSTADCYLLFAVKKLNANMNIAAVCCMLYAVLFTHRGILIPNPYIESVNLFAR